MARVSGVSDREAGMMTRAAYMGAKRMVGKVPLPMRIMALNPWVMRAYGAFEMAMGRAKTVEPGLKALASIKAAGMVGCVF
jgi:hypothetical protein